MEKRGQVTTFVIVGIALLFVVGATLFVKELVIDRGLFADIREPETIPEQIKSVDYYVDGCIQQVTEEALALLGEQGGYINLEDVNTLEVFPGLNVPYWYYSNGASLYSDYPSKKDMQHSIENYVEDNLKGCIRDFELLEDGFTIKDSSVLSKVQIEDNSVIVKVRYPLDITKEGIEYYLSDHVLEFDVKLGKMYDLAKSIMDKENNELWLENRTLDFIYLYEDDIPHTVLDFSCNPLIWKKSDIKEKLQDILAVNVPLYTVLGTNYNLYYSNDESLVWDIGKEYHDLFVNFQFSKTWPFELDVNPSEGDVVIARPYQGNLKIINFCTNYMNFFYDVKYPLLVTVSDGDYDFNFAIDVNIKNDQPRNTVDSPYKNDDYLDYCDLKEKEVDVYASESDNEGKLKALGNASVFYSCINHNCYIGDTDNNGFLRGKFPLCANGQIEVKKEGYSNSKSTLTTFDGGDTQVSLYLEPFIKKKYEVMVFDKVNGELVGPRELRDDEEVVLEIVKSDGEDVDYGTVALYPEFDTIDLVPELYHVKGSLIKTSPAFIENKTVERCKCPEVLGVCACSSETIELEGENLEELVTGGVELDWLVDRNNLYNSNKIIFYVINEGTPSTYDDLLTTYNVEDVTSGFVDEVIPHYV